MPDLPHRTFAEEVTDAAAWLAVHARPSTGKPFDSYTLKHLVQRDVGAYISSMAVVAAATAAGYRIAGEPTKAGNAWLRLAVRKRPRSVAA